MLIWIGAGFFLAGLAPWLYRLLRDKTGLVLALYPAAVFAFLLGQISAPGRFETTRWMPSLGLELSFRLDGLALLMALLVTGIGALVLVYGGAYLHGHPYLPRFYALILLFMFSMLGVVVSDNALLLFIFWELTSISSFLLIGFEHDQAPARAAAWQALLITGAGGLAMLAGFVLLSQITGSWSLQVWLANGAAVRADPRYSAVFWLVLAGAATKSAQFPFYFWLPNAMAAPTPVSAYLHSATMVKAGVYLLARLLPVLGGTALWNGVIPVLGMLTLLVAMLLMAAQHDLKRLLAYSTIGALGLMVALVGLGSKIAAEALVVTLLAHGLYKGALFLVAGGIDHAAGTRDVRRLGGLARLMPFTAAAALPAVFSMAGVAPALGFIAKELVYEGALAAQGRQALMAGLIFSNAIMAAGAGWCGWLPFLHRKPRLAGDHGHDVSHAHENTADFWVPPLLLSAFSLLAGLFPGLVAPLMNAAAQAVLQQPLSFKLSLWHGFTPALAFSLITLALGLLIYLTYWRIEPRAHAISQRLRRYGPSEAYDSLINNLKRLAAWQTRLFQSGYLRRYVMTIILTTVLISLWAAFRFASELSLKVNLTLEPLRFYDVILVGIIILAALLVVRQRSRLATIALLGAIGYSIALIYLFYSAPDLAMVQIAIETLTVILFVFVIYRLPLFTRLTSPPARALDVLIAGIGGAFMTCLMLLVTTNQAAPSAVSQYYADNALKLANGRNIVNVILVDFRGIDTLGEISVLVIAALGVLALLGLSSNLGQTFAAPRPLPDLEVKSVQRSIILPVAARYLIPLLLVFSFFLLLRGHNEAGGGFVGGLVAAASFMLYGIAVSPQAALKLLPAQPRVVMAVGLLVAACSVSLPLFFGQPIMTGFWLARPLPVLGKLGTPVLFDLGVYLVVIGVTLQILLNLAREDAPR